MHMEKRPKYGNKKTIIDGIQFDSKKESLWYGKLKLMVRAKEITAFSMQPEFPYSVEYSANGKTYKVERKYIADFQVVYHDGRIEIFDIKGVRTAIYKQKKKIIEKLYGIKIIEK